MGIRCSCSAVATGTSEEFAFINGNLVNGIITVSASVCPTCSLNGSLITISFTDPDVPTNSFTFTSTFVNPPNCFPVAGGGESMFVSAQGVAIGTTINGPATLSNITFLDDSMSGDLIGGITINTENSTFFFAANFEGTVEITSCE